VGNQTTDGAGLLRRLGVATGSAVAAVLLVTGCAAGQQAQTVEQTPSIDGVQAEAGTIAIRAAGIATPEGGTSYRKGSDAPLRLVLVNRSLTADKLVSVSSPVASGVRISAGSNSSSAAPGGSSPATSSSASSTAPSASSSSATGSAAGSPSASASPSASGSAGASATGSSSAAQNTPIDLGGRQSVQIGIGSGDPTVTLTGLSTELFPAQTVPVTFTFASGASVTVSMAVQLTSEPPAAPTVSEAVPDDGH
jgi:copper(I)-binding protein